MNWGLLVLAPNPVVGDAIFRYQVLDPSARVEVVVTDMVGKHLQSQQIADFAGSMVIASGSWRPGLYLVNLYKNGERVGCFRLVNGSGME